MSNISCVIHTYNSAQYLDACLSSVNWCSEIVIVDMHSTDETVEIASRHGAKIYFHENVGFADPARAFGLSKCSHQWVLAIDSDEIVPYDLSIKLKEIAARDLCDVARISFRNFFFGREILGSGWGYKNQVIPRFFKKGKLNYEKRVHDFVKIEDGCRIIKIIGENVSIVHFNYNDVKHFIRKLDNYTDFEVESQKYNYGKPLLFRIIYHVTRELVGRFLILKGYKDGWLGLYLAMAMAFYRSTAIAKKNLPNGANAVAIYRNYAKQLLEQYRR
ncbi:glycosyltransferase family 2 protein [Paraburkholderia acidisoli]|uniref:Glycosyltransferase n=1 Tax=Paraburkholderia acidisoli TaxID=2571748 RepID=A0A7Z2GFU5_9BURK|nr:glycosyltransferase family 2 protein [Paraburkholderia acidisoli]QGZ60700.1 glycosyltransferase [Paraburkholderia acidisoli]